MNTRIIVMALLFIMLAGCIDQKKDTDTSISICNKIEDEHYKQRCIEITTGGNGTICKSAGDYIDNSGAKGAKQQSIDNCYSEFALARKNPDICRQTTSALWRDTCFERIAISTKDSAICNEISYNDLVYDCIGRTDLLQSKCDLISNEITKYYCNTYISTKTDKMNKTLETWCKQTFDEQQRNSCYTEVAGLNKLEDYCKNIATEGSRDACYLYVAWEAGNEKICLKVENLIGRNLCY